MNVNDISCLACATSSPDQIMPGQGVMVHGLIPNAPPYEVITTAGICVAGMTAMKHAYNAIRTGEHQGAVAVASEISSAMGRGEYFQAEINQKQLEDAKPEIGFEKDFLRWMLSDGAGAVQLSNQPNPQGISLKFIGLISFLTPTKCPCVCMQGQKFVIINSSVGKASARRNVKLAT